MSLQCKCSCLDWFNLHIMEQRGRRTRQERRQWLVYMLTLVTFWSAVSAQIRYSISEELKEGTAVGNVAKDLGLDKSTLKERGYRIVYGSTEPPFRVNQDDGILYVNRKIDREEVCDRSKVCLIDLKTVSGNMRIIVDVSDVNDSPPVFSKDSYIVQLKENSPIGTVVVQVNATDLDEGSNGEVVYSLSNDIDANVRARFNLNAVTGELTVAEIIDFEESSRYEIDIQASDKGAAALTTDKSVIINIIDVNDNAPEIEVTSFSRHKPTIITGGAMNVREFIFDERKLQWISFLSMLLACLYALFS
uniref:Cadherin domain-containing protein n=1 Tax=Myripristis murdjan TaxID=586833 RepID=A0A667WHZ7_9TELE